MKKRVDISSR